MRALIVRALEQEYGDTPAGRKMTGPLIKGGRKLGPAFPDDKNPHGLAFS